MPYLNCPTCKLSLRSPDGLRRECPRCLRREGRRQLMFVSPLPYRLLSSPLLERPDRRSA